MDKITELIVKAATFSGRGDLFPMQRRAGARKGAHRGCYIVVGYTCKDCHKRFTTIKLHKGGKPKERCPRCWMKKARKDSKNWARKHKK